MGLILHRRPSWLFVCGLAAVFVLLAVALAEPLLLLLAAVFVVFAVGAWW